MCFDPRKAGADELVKRWRERMAERGSALPPRGEARRALLVLCPDGPGDPPRGGASVLARYGTPSDGFAGSILATMARRRAEIRARDEWIAEQEAGPPWWAYAIMTAFGCGIAYLALSAPTPTPGGPPSPPPRSAHSAPGPPHAPGGLESVIPNQGDRR